MTNLPIEICLKMREARRAKGYNQSTLAQLVGCKQSAISMFEAGMTTKISDETVRKMSELLGVPLGIQSDSIKGDIAESVPSAIVVARGYCPNGECLSNMPYLVGRRLFYRPLRNMASPSGGKRCAFCGEFLEMRCPSCGAPLNDGACCATCGNAYVTPVLQSETDFEEYVRARRNEISQVNLL